MTYSSIACRGLRTGSHLAMVGIVSVVSYKIVNRGEHRRSLDVSRFIPVAH
jgi:hypothetical protein